MLVFAVISSLLCSTFAASTVEILAGDPRFSTLVSYVKKAGLVDTLNNGVFTIFAPTNDAFAKLSANTVTALNNVTVLTDVLTYHVTSGSVMSTDASNELLIDMVNGGKARFNIYTHNNVVTIQGSNITEFDKVADNGVIHVIDTVMTQPTGTIVDFVASRPNLSTLLDLVTKAGLGSALLSDHLTLFAPTNAAFSHVPKAQLALIGNDPAMLAKVLTYHVVNSTEYSLGLYKREMLNTLNGDQTLRVHFSHHGSAVLVNNGAVKSADHQATNGVVHVVNHVLLPNNLDTPVVGRR